jgi:hypothetical protein
MLHKIQFLPLLAFLFGLNAAAANYYVDINSGNPIPPYSSWSTASTNIQSAITLATNGDLVLVNDGVYKESPHHFIDPFRGLRGIEGFAKIVISQGVAVSSVDGPGVTVIQGASNVSCACLMSNAILTGFTLTNGSAMPQGNSYSYGGGAYCEGTNVLLSDCIICSNTATIGGGVFLGTLSDCILSNNAAMNGGGANDSVLNDCAIIGNTATTYGGGTYGGILNNCLVESNIVNIGEEGGGFGGGCYSNILNNSLLIGNSAGADGVAAAFGCWLTNCTLCYNRDRQNSDSDNIIQGSTLRNCILYYNDENKYEYVNGNFQYCCLDPGVNYFYSFNFPLCITNAPLFANLTNDFHLQNNSPCINAGANSFVAGAVDLGGNPRIVGGTVDLGAYEYQSPASVISYAYLQGFGLPTDGSVDFTDRDGTAFNVYQDWIAGLDPTNPASTLALLAPPATNNAAGLTVSWQSVSGILYNLQRSTNLSANPAFVTITNISGQSGSTIYRDAAANKQLPYFYRVSVVAPYGKDN